MLKTISLSILLLFLVGCNPLPKSDSAIKYYDSSAKEVRPVAKFQKGSAPRVYNENTCIDGDAVRLIRTHRNKSIEDLYNLGTNCIEISLSGNGIE